jgi:hypothetical protein
MKRRGVKAVSPGADFNVFDPQKNENGPEQVEHLGRRQEDGQRQARLQTLRGQAERVMSDEHERGILPGGLVPSEYSNRGRATQRWSTSCSDA